MIVRIKLHRPTRRRSAITHPIFEPPAQEQRAMDLELISLKIDRSKKRPKESRWAKAGIMFGIFALALLGAGIAYPVLNRPAEVEVVRVRATSPDEGARGGDVILNATGYIVAAHKIELAA